MTNRASRPIGLAAALIATTLSLACGEDAAPSGPPTSPPPIMLPPTVESVTPREGANLVATQVTIRGKRFGSSPLVKIGESAAQVLEASVTTIVAVAPPQAAGRVAIVVTNPDGQIGRLENAFEYREVPVGPPIVRGLSPALGVTTGGTSVEVLGTGFHLGTSLSIDGVLVRPFLDPNGSLRFATPPHAAGTVDVLISNPGGDARLPFTFAAPESFDFNGTWRGFADGPPESLIDLSFTITDGAFVSVTCGSVTVALTSPESVSGGVFTFSVQGLSLSGRMLSTNTATGTINMPPCSPSWYVEKR